MEKFRCTQKSKLHYYNSDKQSSITEGYWLLIPFENQWFNLIDLRKVKAEAEYLNPYEALQIRWIYPEPPQKVLQSTYKANFQEFTNQ
jgi:hypothetical protein